MHSKWREEEKHKKTVSASTKRFAKNVSVPTNHCLFAEYGEDLEFEEETIKHPEQDLVFLGQQMQQAKSHEERGRIKQYSAIIASMLQKDTPTEVAARFEAAEVQNSVNRRQEYADLWAIFANMFA